MIAGFPNGDRSPLWQEFGHGDRSPLVMNGLVHPATPPCLGIATRVMLAQQDQVGAQTQSAFDWATGLASYAFDPFPGEEPPVVPDSSAFSKPDMTFSALRSSQQRSLAPYRRGSVRGLVKHFVRRQSPLFLTQKPLLRIRKPKLPGDSMESQRKPKLPVV